jgi:hypothetical protein
MQPDEDVVYDYDDAGQLTDADYDTQADEDYDYDANGNRDTGYTTGANNRLTADGTYTYEYGREFGEADRDQHG